MILSLISLFTFLLVWIFIIFFYKEQKNIYGINALLIFIIFVSPVIYYFFGGTSYKAFSNKALIYYQYLGSVVILINIIFLILKQRISIKKVSKFIDKSAFKKITLLTKIYLTLLFVLIVLYIIVYFNKFPLIVFLEKHIVIDRPDGTGDIPHFYFMTTIMMMVFPSVFFLLYDNVKTNIVKIITFAIIILFMTIGGHKGIVVFFFIFIWFYVLKQRINVKLISLFFISIIIYAIAKGRVNVSVDNFSYLFHSSFSRMFVTQGAGFIERIHLLIINYNFADCIPLKNQVCSLVYHVGANVCSMPTYFIGDLIVNYGYIFALSVYIILGLPLLYILKITDKVYTNSVFLKWNVFMGLFLFSIAEISVFSLLRLFALILNVVIIYYTSRYDIVKTKNSIAFKYIK